MSVSLGVEDPCQKDVADLIKQLTHALEALTSPDACHHMSVEEMAQPDTTVFVARPMGKPLAAVR